ncbi:MAG: GldG family protein [Magnetococcales bacterium]|nr:GldG family protein [Magnetococcales bacterium]
MKMTSRIRFQFRAQLATTGLLAGIILALLAYASNRFAVRWDLTAAGLHTLSEQSVKAIAAFPEGLRAVVYVLEKGEMKPVIQDMLEKYRYHNPKLEFRFVDPDIDLAQAKADEITMDGTILLRHGNRREKLTEITEEALTNALIRLSKGESKSIRFLTGHGEHPFAQQERQGYGTVGKLLKGEGYQLDLLNLATEEQVPDGTNLVVVAGPRSPLFPIEVERLSKWLEKGGGLLVLHDPGNKSGLEEFFQLKGLRFQDGLVIDLNARVVGGQVNTPLATDYDKSHPITKDMNMVAILPEARGLTLDREKSLPGVEWTPLFFGAARGWLETGDIRSGSVEFNEGVDPKGPILLGAALKQDKSRIVVAGDSDFAADSYIDFSGNSTLFLNMVRWLAADESFIAIKPKAAQDGQLVLTQTGGFLLSWGLIVLLPLALFGTGWWVWFKRRRL